MQLIYGGKTNRSIPNVQFPRGFSLSANPKHYSNEGETKKIIIDIILPRVESVRETLHLSDDFPALLIMDVFRGQMTTAVRELLDEHNVLISFVPNNMTHLFQPIRLDSQFLGQKIYERYIFNVIRNESSLMLG